ncbi:BnaAnng06710D [Brassica napus]|uniref:BnaAnng06710D protein n=1 Tax=Brassica napus TaxID=3708 RepID=A0A078HYV8_BRANA|nr:BnaAnng06710D [Brassica napus]
MAGESRKRKVGLLYDERMCKHDTPDGEDHPECPNRIKAIWAKLQLTGLAQRCVVLGGSKAEDKHLQLVHTKEHVNLVKSLSTKKKDSRRNKIASKLDSIYLNGGSSEAAYLAAGSVVEVAEKVAEGELDCGFAIVRPPGHHAEADEAMGFYLAVKKILIVDWDVHHGNGTQKMFWKDPRVLVFSVHRHDDGSFYPTGDDGDYDKVGEGAGEGFNINVPWEQGRRSGFDAAIGDPRGGCFVTPYGYSVMLKKLMEFAQGKIVMALEGGYNLGSVAKSSLACVQVLLEEKQIQDSFEEYPYESTCRVIEAVRKRLCAYWPSLADELPWEAKTPSSPTSSSSSDDGEEVLESTFIQERCIREAKLTILSIRYKKQAESLRASLEVALEEKAALQTKVAELQGEKLRLQDKYAAEAKEAAEKLTHVSSELREAKIDLDFQRELFKKANEEKKLLEVRVLKLEAELQQEASDKLRLRISRDRYAAEVKEAAEHLAKVRSELRDVQIDLNLHRKLPKKAKKVM